MQSVSFNLNMNITNHNFSFSIFIVIIYHSLVSRDFVFSWHLNQQQTNVSMKSVTHQRFISSMAGSSVTETVNRSTVRRRSISDPVDPSALLQSMSNLGRASRLSDGWTVESGSFYRQPERHESSQSSDRGPVPIYLRLTALRDTPSGHDKKYNTKGGCGKSSSGLSQTDVTLRNPHKPRIPIPITVVQSAEMPHFYEELTSVQNSRQLLE